MQEVKSMSKKKNVSIKVGRKVVAKKMPDGQYRYAVFMEVDGEFERQTHWLKKEDAEKMAKDFARYGKKFGFRNVMIVKAVKPRGISYV